MSREQWVIWWTCSILALLSMFPGGMDGEPFLAAMFVIAALGSKR